jgi:hypothetical protein
LDSLCANKRFVSSLCYTDSSHSPLGRVRITSTYNGERTLLQLPNPFPATSDIIDLKVFGKRLAGVTSDGGFVVWEMPPVIMGDERGKLLLTVAPTFKSETLKSVQWHPEESDTVAVASDSKIYVIDIAKAFEFFGSNPVNLIDLRQVGHVIFLSSVSARNMPNRNFSSRGSPLLHLHLT